MAAKRLFDLFFALLVLVLCAPLLLAIAILVKLGSRGPVFYRGRRVGKNGRLFRMWKFRSMVVGADATGNSVTAFADPRVTPVGAFLRRAKLDELPQLLNVLNGDMSLVGPRPEAPEYVAMYTEQQRCALRIKPGITDWASIWDSDEAAALKGAADPQQVYRDVILPGKLALQLSYISDRSFGTDVKILCYTVVRLFSRNWLPSEVRHRLEHVHVRSSLRPGENPE